MCPTSVHNTGGWWSHTATKSENQHMPKPTRIVVSCHPGWKKSGILHLSSMRTTARMSHYRYLSRASSLKLFRLISGRQIVHSTHHWLCAGRGGRRNNLVIPFPETHPSSRLSWPRLAIGRLHLHNHRQQTLTLAVQCCPLVNRIDYSFVELELISVVQGDHCFWKIIFNDFSRTKAMKIMTYRHHSFSEIHKTGLMKAYQN